MARPGARAPPQSVPPADAGELFRRGAVRRLRRRAAGRAEGAAAAATRKRAPSPTRPKLHKVLAQAGIGSRRDMEQMIVEGRITVNGEPAHIGQRISFGDRIAVGGKPVRCASRRRRAMLAYHKPAGEVVTHDDPQHRPTVFRLPPAAGQVAVGGPAGHQHRRPAAVHQQRRTGQPADAPALRRRARVRGALLGLLDDEQRPAAGRASRSTASAAPSRASPTAAGRRQPLVPRDVITEGRNREVRKLFEAVGHAVSRLIRIRYGSVVLPRGLAPRGVWVDLDDADVRDAARCGRRPAGASARPEGRGARRRRIASGPTARKSAAATVPARDPTTGPVRAGRDPNPLQQTADKRAIQQGGAAREKPEDGPIPNPLQQTYDRRAMQRSAPAAAVFWPTARSPTRAADLRPAALGRQAGRRGFGPGGSGAAVVVAAAREPGSDAVAAEVAAVAAAGERGGPRRGGSVGYIGADALHRRAAASAAAPQRAVT